MGLKRHRKTFRGVEKLTKDSELYNADINTIMSRYQINGDALPPPQTGLRYGDFSNPDDYLEVMSRVRRVERAFNMLPAAVRSRFRNDPAAMVQWVADPENAAEAGELGLLDPAPTPSAPATDSGPASPPEEPSPSPAGVSEGNPPAEGDSPLTPSGSSLSEA